MNPNSTLKKLVLLFWIVFCFSSLKAQFHGTYSIGISKEFTSITSAIDSLVMVGISGPTVFEIDSGTYIENVSIPELTGASEINPITFKAKNDSVNDVIIQSTASATITFNGADYITFQSVTITNTSQKCISIVNEANHITIDSCIVIGRNMLANNRSYDVIVNEASSNDSYTTIKNCTISRGSIGIIIRGYTDNPNEKGHVLRNNTFVNTYVHDILVSRSDSILITENKITNNTNATHNNACAILLQVSEYSEISNNLVTTHKHGIRIHMCDSGNLNMVKNNMVTVKRSNSAYYYPLYISGGNKNLKIYNNSFYNTYPYTLGTVFGSYSEPDENISLVNNIFVSASDKVAMFDSNSEVYHIDYNNFYVMKSGDMFRFDNSWYSNLESSSAFVGSNNVSFDPQFVNYKDLHVLNPILGNLGTPLPEVEFDIDQETRDSNTPDIGADEFDPFDTLDIAISKVQFVEAPICSNPTDITFTFKNIGNNTVRSFKVERLLNGEVQDTITENITLNSYQEETITFDYSNFKNGDSIQYRVVEINNKPDPRPENSTYINNGIWLGLKDNIIVENDIQLDSAINQLKLSGICNSIEIIIKSGTYEQPFYFQHIPGTNENSTVTVRSESGTPEDVLIAPNSATYAVFDVFEIDYLTIKDLTIVAEGNNLDGIGFYGEANHLTLDNLIIYADTTGIESGIDSYSSTDDNHLTITNCEIYDGKYGIYIKGSNKEDSILIQNNLIKGKVAKTGIYASYVGNISIRGNIIDIDSSYIANGFEIYNVYDRIELLNNQVYIDSTIGGGLDIEYIKSSNTNYSMVANNVISLGGQPWAGVYTYEIVNTKFYNNTLIVSSVHEDDYTLYLDYFSVVDIRNNQIIAKGNATAIKLNEAPIGITNMDYNNIYADGSRLVDYYGTDLSTFAEWQSYGWDLNSYSIDPEFYDNFKSCNAELNNKGIHLDAMPITDLLGINRSSTTPDIGAVEFGIPSNLKLGDDFIMCDDSYTLYAGAGDSFSWNTSESTHSINITNPGEYYVEVSGCGLTETDTIVIHSPEIKADFDAVVSEYTIALINTSTGVIENYLWNMDGYESNSINEAITFNGDGTYYISLEVSNQCRSDITDTSLVFTYTGVDELSANNMRIYPNPVSEWLNISFDSETTESTSISIYNSIGQLEMQIPETIYTGSNTINLNVAHLKQGIYFVKIENKPKTLKILKK